LDIDDFPFPPLSFVLWNSSSEQKVKWRVHLSDHRRRWYSHSADLGISRGSPYSFPLANFSRDDPIDQSNSIEDIVTVARFLAPPRSKRASRQTSHCVIATRMHVKLACQLIPMASLSGLCKPSDFDARHRSDMTASQYLPASFFRFAATSVRSGS